MSPKKSEARDVVHVLDPEPGRAQELFISVIFVEKPQVYRGPSQPSPPQSETHIPSVCKHQVEPSALLTGVRFPAPVLQARPAEFR